MTFRLPPVNFGLLLAFAVVCITVASLWVQKYGERISSDYFTSAQQPDDHRMDDGVQQLKTLPKRTPASMSGEKSEDKTTGTAGPSKTQMSSSVEGAVIQLLRPESIHSAINARLDAYIKIRLAKARLQKKKMEEEFVFQGNNQTLQHNKTLPLFVTLSVPSGGLGNYMFMTAALIGVARKNKRAPILMYPDYRGNYFEGLTLEVINETRILNTKSLHDSDILVEPGAGRFMHRVANLSATPFHNRTAVLRGYLQSWMYFDDFREEIRTVFTFKEHTLTAAKKAICDGFARLSNTTALNNLTRMPTLIGIHVRRGDILFDPHKSGGQVPASEEYLLRMALRYQRRYSPVVFVVISNDIKYCQKLFLEDNFIFVADSPLEVDMAIMTLMEQMVMTVGSYSFWGAYLNDQARDISYFRDWPRANSSLAAQTNASEYFLPEWSARV